MHLRVWKELANVIARHLTVIFESQWQLEAVSDHLEKVNITSMVKKGKKEASGNYRLVSFASVPGWTMEQFLLEAISNQMKDKLIWNSQYGFANISCKQIVSEQLDCFLWWCDWPGQ